MRMGMGMFGIVVLGGALLVAGGCAKKDMVKQDEPVAGTQSPTPAQAAVPKPTPAPAKAAPEEPARPLPVQGETVSMKEPAVAAPEVKSALEKIYFAFDSFALTEQSRETLYKNAEQIIKKSTAKYTVEGHCDERGSDEYNLALGEKRAKSAFNYLITLGVPAERLTTVSFGEERPADPGHDEEAWAKNRRAEFSITK
jgi:peptidoglycan-associated lipoprotein